MQKVIAIVGPTASGKSALAVSLARALSGEVVSADSRQVYRGLDIGSGKITQREMQGIPHHLLDVASPSRQFSAARFKTLGSRAIRNIAQHGKLPIVCGGTGFYVDSLLSGLSLPEVPPNQALRKKLRGKSAAELFAMLKRKDHARANTIDAHNPVRLIRALEIVSAVGKVPSIQQAKKEYDVLWIGISLPEKTLRKKIHTRLLARMKQGMLAEARALHKQGLSFRRMEELGLEYRYLARHLQGKISKEEMLEQLEREIIQYAKRQMRWFKRNSDIRWYTPEKTREIKQVVKSFLGSKMAS